MNVYRLQAEREGYRWLMLAQAPDLGLVAVLQGVPAAELWTTPTVATLELDFAREDRALPLPDFPVFSTSAVLSRRAVDALLDLLVENGEILPLACAEGEFFVFNVTRVLDALDEPASEIKRFRGGSRGRAKSIVRHAFRPERLTSAVFRIPQKPHRVYVTQGFVDRVEQAGLTGFDFGYVWPPLDRETHEQR
ncbi:imm11 family protein [Longimicrobium sp.]|uniref:imm11 family protein n=1 Tax=Longimicrobium sp. TaxID=2029185 RepID=UPI002E348F61|nr:DUF1629 domain-containing protein [Longimicrobium sp.]HEX6040854.1 DUF1629 domain-containing protein [Longimicrobium sp.]